MHFGQRERRHAVSMIYALVALVMLAGFVSLGADYARVQLVKTELQRAADAGARYGAMALPNGATAVRNNAIAAAGDNLADGSPVVLQTTDAGFGAWNGGGQPVPATTTFCGAAGGR